MKLAVLFKFKLEFNELSMNCFRLLDIIRNIFDFTQIVNILIKNIEINWEIIGKKININPNQCKNDWEKIKKEYKVDQLCKIKQDIIMVKKYEFKNIFLYI